MKTQLNFGSVVGLALTALLLGLGACGGGGEGDGDGLCSGCMSAAGCIAPHAQNDTMCGSGGAACYQCEAGKRCDRRTGTCQAAGTNTCPGGVCAPLNSQPCNPLTCDGCCDDTTNTCVPKGSQSAQQCGLNNQTCSPCGSGMTCSDGVCIFGRTPGQCDPLLECKAVDGSCHDGFSDSLYCGRPGETCNQCTGDKVCSNGVCVPRSSVVTCNCPDGCCDAMGGCIRFQDQNELRCGMANRQCQSCPQQTWCNTTAGRCESTATRVMYQLCVSRADIWDPSGELTASDRLSVQVVWGSDSLGTERKFTTESSQLQALGGGHWQAYFYNDCAPEPILRSEIINQQLSVIIRKRAFLVFGDDLLRCSDFVFDYHLRSLPPMTMNCQPDGSVDLIITQMTSY